MLLEPVLNLPPQDGLEAAERERHEETNAAPDEAVEVHLECYRAALGGQLKVERPRSQHWLLWTAFRATARAVRALV